MATGHGGATPEVITSLNTLAATMSGGQPTQSAAAAANIWAGQAKPYLELIGALNKKNGTTGVEYNLVCNQLAGTTGLSAQAALAVAAGLATA